MDFAIKRKRAIDCAGGKRPAKACAIALAGEGMNLTMVARAGLTGFIAESSRQTPTCNVSIHNALPGALATETMKRRVAAVAEQSGKSVDDIARQRPGSMPAGHFGGPPDLVKSAQPFAVPGLAVSPVRIF